MATSERPLIDAALLAIEEINHNGGVMGRRIEAVIEDGASEPLVFKTKARKLIEEDGVCSVFGCWTSESRKAVLAVFETHDHLLWYPVQYEGDEASPNVFYTGAAPNQQIIPALRWCLRQNRGTRIFLVGSDTVFPRKANELIKRYLESRHLQAVGEEYRKLGDWDFRDVVTKIHAVKPDWIFNTVNGDSNVALFKALDVAGIRTPIMSVSIAEVELPSIGIEKARGNFCAWNYFQSLETGENKRFVQAFKTATAQERVTDDPIEAAYFQVHLFAKAVNKAKSVSPPAIRRAARNLEFRAPGGWVRIDPETQHTWKTARIAQIDDRGQFQLLESSDEPVKPDPYLRDALREDPPRKARTESPTALLDLLCSNEVGDRRHAARAIGHVPPTGDLARALCKALADDDWLVRRHAAETLARCGRVAADSLTEALKRRGPGRALAANALAEIGPPAARSVPALIECMHESDPETCEQAARALGRIGPEARAAVPSLIHAMEGHEMSVRLIALDALGQLGADAREALPHLRQAVNSPGPGFSPRVANAAASIAADMRAKRETAALADLEKVVVEIERAGGDELRPALQRLKSDLEFLRAVEDARWLERLWLQASQNRWFVLLASLLALYLGATLFFWQVGLRVFPLWILRANLALKPHTEFKILEWFTANVPLPYLLALGWFRYHPRVLDAWVAQHVALARRNFLTKYTVRERDVYLDLPVEVDGKINHSIGAATFLSTCQLPRWCVGIWGEGGSGKTSLACRLARWALGVEQGNWLCPTHVMLPVLLEPGLGAERVRELSAFRETVRGQLAALIGSVHGIPNELLDELLRRKRVMVIVDDLAALAGKDWQLPCAADFPVMALVVTSRLADDLGGVPMVSVLPQRIRGAFTLTNFFSNYLQARGQSEKFSAEEITNACGRLFKIEDRGRTGPEGGTITALFAKMYAEQLIGMKEAGGPVDLPASIPGLMLGYLDTINRRSKSLETSDRAVQRAAKKLAWECLHANYRPGVVHRDGAAAALADDGGEVMLNYFENDLLLIHRVGPRHDEIRFALDPLAEYLAGMHLIETHGTEEPFWREFLAEVDRRKQAGDGTATAFLLAVRDCCLDPRWYGKLPDRLAVELGARAGLDAVANTPPPIRVGILHSREGPMAISEPALVDAARIAIDEINQSGGVLGRQLHGIFQDGESNPSTFRHKAIKLIDETNVCTLFGCWTSECRKAVLEVVESRNHLLWYPVQYEGFESSPNIIYAGAAPNQQIIPAIDFCLDQLNKRRFFLLGWRSVFPWRANQIIKSYLDVVSRDTKAPTGQASVVGEEYLPFDATDYREVIQRILKARPDVIFNTVNGQGNNHLFRALQEAGIGPVDVPVMSVSIAEVELDIIGWALTEGHYCAWNYFQSLSSPANMKFVKLFQKTCGSGRMTNDPIEAAYSQVHLFAAAVRRAGSTDPREIRKAVRGLEVAAPGGLLRIDEENQHAWKVARIGRICRERIEIVWSSEKPIRPDPYCKQFFPTGLNVGDPPWERVRESPALGGDSGALGTCSRCA
jgi:urea ABC transporter urea binding protein